MTNWIDMLFIQKLPFFCTSKLTPPASLPVSFLTTIITLNLPFYLPCPLKAWWYSIFSLPTHSSLFSNWWVNLEPFFNLWPLAPISDVRPSSIICLPKPLHWICHVYIIFIAWLPLSCDNCQCMWARLTSHLPFSTGTFLDTQINHMPSHLLILFCLVRKAFCNL